MIDQLLIAPGQTENTLECFVCSKHVLELIIPGTSWYAKLTLEVEMCFFFWWFQELSLDSKIIAR